MYDLNEAVKHGEFQKLLVIMSQYTTGQQLQEEDDSLTTLLLDNMHLLHYSLSLHDSIHSRDVVEPCTLAPLLELLAEGRLTHSPTHSLTHSLTHEGAERQGLLQHALALMRYAQRVCERTLGTHSLTYLLTHSLTYSLTHLGVSDEQSIRVSFQVLRLQLRASSTPEGYQTAGTHSLTYSLTHLTTYSPTSTNLC